MGAQVIPSEPDKAHLGGYVAGGDDATWYPDMWKWMVEKLKIKTVVDVGCGDGQALKYFRDTLKCEVFGIDGIPQDDPDIMELDFTDETMTYAPRCDLVWCCEFVEHIEERFIRNFLPTFKAGRYVAMTHAQPGQAGHHHVNCQTAEYWIGVLAAIGFKYDHVLTNMARLAAAANPNQWNHFKRSGLVFKRYE